MPNNLNQVHNTLNHTIFLLNFLLLKNSLIVSIMLVQFNNLSFCCVNVVFIKTCYVMNPHSLSKQIQENKIFNKSSDFVCANFNCCTYPLHFNQVYYVI